ncbi:MAG: DsbA family protein [Geodermatophilaceae bacterium]
MTETNAGGAGDDDGEALANPDPATITVWSDLSCPWATLALHTLRLAARRRGVDMLIDHRAFPLELFNRSPTPKELVDAEVTVIAGHIPDLGWQLWHGPTHAYPSTLLPAMEAVQAAKDPTVGGLWASDELDQALRHAFFVDSQCISIHPVILDIAERCVTVDHRELARLLAEGRGRAEVYRQWRTAQGHDVQGSPHLFTAGGIAVHNPGATSHWTARPPLGFPLAQHGLPVFEHYDSTWPEALLDDLGHRVPE